MKRKRGGIVSQLLMILLVVVIIFPLYFMTANSFKTHEEYVNNMAGLPQTFYRYKTLWKLSGENRSDNGL